MSAPPASPPGRSRWRYPLAAVPVALLGGAMLAAVLDLPPGPLGLRAEVDARLAGSGVAHPVTAVLLNLRAYDTWLEIVALLIAAVAMLLTREAPLEDHEGDPPGEVVSGLVQRLVPLVLIVAVFVLALGTASPGGAFQAGALLAAGLYLLHLAGYPLTRWLGDLRRRLVMAAGTLAFLLVALAGLLLGVHALELPARVAPAVIVAVEVAVTCSVALTLFILLAGAAPARSRAREEAGEVAAGRAPR